GLNAVLQGLRGKLERVLLYDTDYPSLNLPFELGPFEVFYVKSSDNFHISTEDIIEKIEEEGIDLVALSHVQFLTGFKLDIEAVGKYCRENGIVFILDATQSMGATLLDFDTLPVDVIISSSYKWVNGGYGSAVLCVRKSLIEEYPPHIAGFGSLDQSNGGWNYEPSNKSFEPGHMNPVPLLQLAEGIRHKVETGLAHIDEHNTELIKRLHNGLLDLPFKVLGENDLQNCLHILIFEAGEEVANKLKEANFAITWRKNSI